MIAKISNKAQLGIKNLGINIDYPDSSGRRQQITRRFQGVIPAGKFYSVNLKLGPYKDSSILNTVRTSIVNAQLVENRR